MKFIETKREELRRERIALNEQEWPELVQLLKGIGDKFINPYATSTLGCIALRWQDEWIRTDDYNPTITLAELKAKYFEPETREPKVGDWGYFWDHDDKEYATFGKLLKIDGSAFHTSLPYKHFSHTIPPHIQEAMKESQYEVVYSFGPSSGQIVVEKEIAPGLYAGTRGGVNVVLKRITP